MQLFIANKNYSSWSLRPWVLMREAGIPFEERLVPFSAANRETFSKFSPTAKVPCLHDGASVVWESLGIVEYLAERYPGVWPEDREARAWARCAAAEMHAGFGELRRVCTMNCGVRIDLHEISDALGADWARIEQLWKQGLERFGGPFLAGATVTAVDAFFAPLAFRWQTYGMPLDPAAEAYAQRLLDLPSMRAWYADALAETWREPRHEEEARSVGVWRADLRTLPT